MSDDGISFADTAKLRLNRVAAAERKAALSLAAHDLASLKLCVTSAWVHGFISIGRAHELAEVLGCKPGELEALIAIEEEEAHADD